MAINGFATSYQKSKNFMKTAPVGRDNINTKNMEYTQRMHQLICNANVCFIRETCLLVHKALSFVLSKFGIYAGRQRFRCSLTPCITTCKEQQKECNMRILPLMCGQLWKYSPSLDLACACLGNLECSMHARVHETQVQILVLTLLMVRERSMQYTEIHASLAIT